MTERTHGGTHELSDDHKRALAEGRARAKAITAYLDTLGPKTRGVKRSSDTVEKRLVAIDYELDAHPKSLKRLQLLQERRDLIAELSTMDDGPDLEILERDFVLNAKAYGEHKGIDYPTWREFGVPVAVLNAAGIKRKR